MRPIQLICDSTGGFSPEEKRAQGVIVLPLTLQFANGASLLEENRESFLSYYSRLARESVLPSTSQPSLEVVTAAFQETLEKGFDIIAICLSENLSGTYSTFTAAAKQISPERIRVIDCRCCSVSVKYLVETARSFVDAGLCLDAVAANLLREAEGNGAIMVVEDLRYIKKGGRCNNLTFFVGKLLRIHPILKMVENQLVAYDRARGMKNAVEKMIADLPEKLNFLTVLHCDNLELAKNCTLRLQARFSDLCVRLEDLSPVIGTHLGNGSVGFIYHEPV